MMRAMIVACGCALVLSACERQVFVQRENEIMQNPIGSPPTGAAGIGGAAGIIAPPVGGASGMTGGVIAGTGATGGFGGMIPSAGQGSETIAPEGLLAGIDQAWPNASNVLERFEVVTEELGDITRPATGASGVSLVQHQGANRALILRVGWNHQVERWYGDSGAYQAYNAAHYDRHFSLLHAETYGIFADGSGVELSGTPATYKEYLAASEAGIAWVDYPAPVGDTFGEVVLLDGAGVRTVLTDRTRYRAGIALSASHIAFVEYAHTQPGAIGQVCVQPLAGGPAVAVAPSASHQDRPAIEGDWLVFEEYLTTSDAVIRAFNVVSGELRDLSATTGFRTNADIRAGRVVWEDYRSGSADIFGAFLDATGEHPIASGSGHSAVPRVTGDGLIWVESNGSTVALVRAAWRAP